MILYLVTLFCLVVKIESLTCLSCKNISQPDNCTSVTTCNTGQKCYTTAVWIGQDTVFNLGCRGEQECLRQSSPYIFGRSVGTQCSQCCAVDRCNEQLCSAGTQVHGGWSGWDSWSSCSQTCGIGTQSRRRACDNPVPKLFRDHCIGDNVDFKSCFIRSCQDGGWSLWKSWSSCTSGRKIRTRVCNNPKPSQFGRNCSGSTKELDNCGPVAFTVTLPNRTIVAGHPLFTNVVTNVGGGYSTDTGIFTCPVAGLYEFNMSLWAYGPTVYCWIGKNGADIAFARTASSSSDYSMASKTVYLLLSVGDKVSLQNCYGWDHVYTDHGSSFSGSLIN